MSPQAEYSQRLRRISNEQFQAALDVFALGEFQSATPVSFRRDSHNVYIACSTGEFVLRGAAAYSGQFDREQFFTRAVAEKTDVHVPWPFRVRASADIFGWKGGFAIMPRLAGLQLADPDVAARLSRDDQRAIARLQGGTLRSLQAAQCPVAGFYDPASDDITPFQDGFAAWFTATAGRVLDRAAAQGALSDLERDDARQFIADAHAALSVPFTPVVVLNNFTTASLIASHGSQGWTVSGLTGFDEAFYADGEIDLIRQIAEYLDADAAELAQHLLAGYGGVTMLREHYKQRLAAYMLADRLEAWLTQRQHADAGNERSAGGFSDYVHRYLDGLAALLR